MRLRHMSRLGQHHNTTKWLLECMCIIPPRLRQWKPAPPIAACSANRSLLPNSHLQIERESTVWCMLFLKSRPGTTKLLNCSVCTHTWPLRRPAQLPFRFKVPIGVMSSAQAFFQQHEHVMITTGFHPNPSASIIRAMTPACNGQCSCAVEFVELGPLD